VRTEVFRADRRTDRQTDRQTDMTKLIVTFRNFVNAPNDTQRYVAMYFKCHVLSFSSILVYKSQY